MWFNDQNVCKSRGSTLVLHIVSDFSWRQIVTFMIERVAHPSCMRSSPLLFPVHSVSIILHPFNRKTVIFAMPFACLPADRLMNYAWKRLRPSLLGVMEMKLVHFPTEKNVQVLPAASTLMIICLINNLNHLMTTIVIARKVVTQDWIPGNFFFNFLV